MTKLWTESKGKILAGPQDVEKAQAISALLVRPIGLLPQTSGDQIKPFAIGVWTDTRVLLKPDTPVISLRRATSAYTHSKRYFFACAQPDARRHDIDWNAIVSVSPEDRMAAQETFSKLKTDRSETTSPPSPTAAPIVAMTAADRIRAGILGRSRTRIA
ncbi:ProQ/FINO family protein [Rhizobium leguminosarum]|uniref:ProQ/FINO family protein n=1 Tax=Rhizobium leguminosarum TaxID=384 RepID=UPI00143F7203|nr:ProQ/FINO family protein [Rhizobium leguminosarum]NKL24745.1 ProQ/FINO family protein [Rhizobium leguminosarum bv. viciae]NKL59940.1 ProQ/FINO family protein [Rhizobium leguminosarum bv. viciae]